MNDPRCEECKTAFQKTHTQCLLRPHLCKDCSEAIDGDPIALAHEADMRDMRALSDFKDRISRALDNAGAPTNHAPNILMTPQDRIAWLSEAIGILRAERQRHAEDGQEALNAAGEEIAMFQSSLNVRRDEAAQLRQRIKELESDNRALRQSRDNAWAFQKAAGALRDLSDIIKEADSLEEPAPSFLGIRLIPCNSIPPNTAILATREAVRKWAEKRILPGCVPGACLHPLCPAGLTHYVGTVPGCIYYDKGV